MYPPGHFPSGHLPPRHIPPRTYTPRTHTPKTLKCPIWFMHHVFITNCTLKIICFAGRSSNCDAGAIKLSDICSVRKGLIPTTNQALDIRGRGGGIVPMSDVNFNKYPFCPSGQVLEKNRERTNDRTCISLYWPFIVTFSIKTFLCPFFSFCFVFFTSLSLWSRKKKRYRCVLKNEINYSIVK